MERFKRIRLPSWKTIRGKCVELFVCAYLIAGLLLPSGCNHKQSLPAFNPQIIARSRVSDGDLSRLQRVFAKARRGEPVTIGFIGGSITRGQAASVPERGYANLLAGWWGEQFPQSKITLVNAGVSGTNSNYGCLRVDRDLLSKHPDFVVVEFGVNDRDDLAHVETYEGVVRQLMADPDQPVVVLLFMMHHDGTNAQQLQSEVGRQYGLPMISFRDALWPEILAGRMQYSDYYADTVHPNDRGHAAIATFIESLLQETLDHLPPNVPTPAATLPPPRFTDLFANTRIIPADDLRPISCDGWTYESSSHSWRADQPGSSIAFQITGDAIDLLYEKMDGGFGTAKVTVDGGEPMVFDSWLNGSWGPMTQTDLISRAPGSHRVRVELLEEKNAMSTGNEFHILGLGVASR
jgi:lysophospholipase L1-like esterase